MRVHHPAVQADTRAAKHAGVRGTPTLLLFRTGEFLTEIAGAPSYPMLKNAIGL